MAPAATNTSVRFMDASAPLAATLLSPPAHEPHRSSCERFAGSRARCIVRNVTARSRRDRTAPQTADHRLGTAPSVHPHQIAVRVEPCRPSITHDDADAHQFGARDDNPTWYTSVWFRLVLAALD